MPEIKLQFGKMDLESDPSGKRDEVSAYLINAFRVGQNWHRVPGLTTMVDTGTNLPVYGYYSTLHNICLAVSGTNLYKITESTATVVMWAAFTPNTPAIFAEDATRILIAANSRIHVYTVATGVLTQLTTQAPVNVTHICILNGILIANGLDSGGGGVSGDFGWSDAANYDVWQYENNAAKPDNLQAVISTINGDVFMIGKESIEVNYLSQDPTAPFAVNRSSAKSYGTPSRYSVAYDGQNVYMIVVVGGNRQILKIDAGHNPQLISFPVGTPLDQIADITDMRAIMMGYKGKTFYVLTCPPVQTSIEDELVNGLTLAFDIRNEEWLIWGKWDGQEGLYNEYPARSFAYAESWGNKRIAGGDNGKIYLLDDSHTFDSDIIRMALRMGWRSHGTMTRQKNCLLYAYDFKAGVGDAGTPDPRFQHRWRNDGNEEWNIPRLIKMGMVGQRAVPLKSRQCGRYYKRQDELVFSDAVEIVFIGIYEEVEVQR